MAAVVLIGTLPKLTLDGLADGHAGAALDVNGIGEAGAAGDRALEHVRRAARRGQTLVGVKRSFTLQVPGPANPPPVPQVSKSNAKGALIPEPEAISVR